MTKLLADKAQRRAEGTGVKPGPIPGGPFCRVGSGTWPGGPLLWLPVMLGAGVQGKPPLDCSGSPRSMGSRALGLYSRLGRKEASRILQAKENV